MRKIYLVVITLLALAPVHAHADPIQVSTSVGVFDVTTVNGRYIDLRSVLRSQVWFGPSEFSLDTVDPTLALEFAAAVGNSLDIGGRTPFFAVDAALVTSAFGTFDIVYFVQYPSTEVGADTWRGLPRDWVIATPVTGPSPTPVPEPGVLGLLVIGLVAFGLTKGKRDV